MTTEGARVYGIYLIPEAECCDLPVIEEPNPVVRET
jgi:hypothetical protein